WLDEVLSRLVDVLMAVPPLILALMLLAIVGPSIPNMVGVIAVIYVAPVYRLSRAAAMNVVGLDFVEAAKLRGERTPWLLRREILPNIWSTLIAEFGVRFCFVFLFIAALSFLGIGIQPPTADWGSMVKENATLISFGDITPLIPAAAIALLTVAINLIVDWMLHRASGLKS
ncbi:ABC transporter permease, partial [Sulfitobacter sp. M22386]